LVLRGRFQLRLYLSRSLARRCLSSHAVFGLPQVQIREQGRRFEAAVCSSRRISVTASALPCFFFYRSKFFSWLRSLCSDLICGQVRPHDIGSVAECSWILSPVSSVLLVRKQARRLDFLSFSRFGFSFTALHRTASLIDFCFSLRVWCHERICCELRFPRAIFRDLFSFASAGDCRSLILVPVRSPIRVRVFDLDDSPTEACY
jgi:hypothetical protein